MKIYNKEIFFLTERNFFTYRSAQIIYDWEDHLDKNMNIGFKIPHPKLHQLFYRFNKYKLTNIVRWLDQFRPKQSYYLYYDMTAELVFRFRCMSDFIPIIIDFWMKDEDILKFFKNYDNCKAVLFTSKQAYDKVISLGWNKPIYHFPLSLPDKSISQERILSKKKFDFIIAGRINPIYLSYLEKYEEDHLDFEYVFEKSVDGRKMYFSNRRGNLQLDTEIRENYLMLLAQAQYTFYCTPGLDPAKEGANGYNQVTPRFFELLSAGCVVFGDFEENSDAEFYNMESMCVRISNYAEFVDKMKFYKKRENVNLKIQTYYLYLCKHSTSSRAGLLKSILNDIFKPNN